MRPGFSVATVPFSLNLPGVVRQLRRIRPVLVFNLVESVAADGRMVALAPTLLDHLGIPYSGCSAESIHVTSHKPTGKYLMHAAGLPTAPWLSLGQLPVDPPAGGSPCLIKAVWEHASVGLESRTVPMDGPEALKTILLERAARRARISTPSSTSMGASSISRCWPARCCPAPRSALTTGRPAS
jgi:D-alanine-D-alanine ligase